MAATDDPTRRKSTDTWAPEIPGKPDPDDFEKPVAWLFGRELIANLKWVLLYTAFKGKLDARDWMNAAVIPASDSLAKVDEFWRLWNDGWTAEEDGKADSEKEFWFDYISDTGDGQKAVYSIAYLCLSDFAVSKNPQINKPATFVLKPDVAKLDQEGKMLLPRGTFLFVGGDTSYHISDYATLANRFQNPFYWAFRDLLERKASSVMMEVPRLLFGIPGNHDYYDSLDGFNRQFRRPSTEDKLTAGQRPPQLMLPTFRREQEASFLALHLPFDWWFWGLDTEQGEIDFRQLEFFKEIQSKYSPRKLIVATPEPTTAFGKFATPEKNQSKTFKELGLERAFLKQREPLGAGKCRIDLSGDIHHYARYWGPPPASGNASNYASVMSGGGGAFFHPSHTNVREVSQQVVYPQPEASRAKTANQIFKFRNIVSGGYVWLFGFLISFVLFFAANLPQSSRDAFNSFPPSIKLEIAPPVSAQESEPRTSFVKPMPRYTFGPNALPRSPNLFLWIVSLIGAIVALVLALAYSARLFKKEYDPARTKPKKRITGVQRFVIWALVLIGFSALASGILGFRSWEFPEAHLTRYGRSLIVLVALIWSLLAIIESVWYSEWLFEEAYTNNIKAWHYWPIWLLVLTSILGFSASLWFFGKQEAAFLVSDLAHLIVLIAVIGGLIYFAVGVGGTLKKGFMGKIGFGLLGASHALLQIAVPFLLVRKGHLIWATLVALVIVFVFKHIGKRLARKEKGWPLATAWIVFGTALIVTPFVFDASISTNLILEDWLPPPAVFDGVALNMQHGRLTMFFLCLYAGAIGAIMSCVLFGFYLAVALAFNGHNNEAGGAARIEGFKQFIRFRINREGLTGFVIAIDDPKTDASELKPRIVDVFHLRQQ